MKRVWKYVRQVEKHLPLSERVKIGGSIYADLRDQVKAREAELGRLLEDSEIDAITRDYGEPRQVVGRLAICQPGEHPLVDRYLAAIGRHLPQDKAGDILAEMREALESTIEGKESETGAPLDENAIAAILKDFGPPMVVATRYAKRDRLIGPDLYPFFWPSVKALAGALAALAIVFAFIGTMSDGDWSRFVTRSIGGFIDVVLPALGVLLIVFIILDRTDSGAKIAANWNPKSLPQDHIRKPKPLFDSIIGLGFDAIFILWWVKAVDFAAIWRADHTPSLVLHLADVWAQNHTIILILACASAAAHIYDILHPGWSRLRAGFSIATHLVGIIVAILLVRAPALIVTGPSGSATAERTENLAGTLNLNMRIGLAIIALIMALSIVAEVWRLIQSAALNAARRRQV